MNLAGKELMGAFTIGNYLDLVTTLYARNLSGIVEVNPTLSGSFSNGDLDHIFVQKIAIAAVLTGVYALSAGKNSIWHQRLERGLQYTTVAMWGIVIPINAVSIGLGSRLINLPGV